ncbi:MAG: large subunit ribosomal protein L5 [Elusimicrobia bacterium]|nr:MAG: large subunit ribosomal protein L5 [Elusimicrobiota bacterium]
MAEKNEEKKEKKMKTPGTPHPQANVQKPKRGEGPVKLAGGTGTYEKSVETPRMKAAYLKEIIPLFMKEHGKDNVHAVPRLTKIVVNMGVSEARENIQVLDSAREELAVITGQLPQVRRAKKSISNFKLREGMPIGLRVTLRGDRMWEFFDRLVSVAVPRMRDFRGLEPRGFDGHGNYNLGLKEHHIFPEINMEKSAAARGMNITFVTSAGNDKDGFELLAQMGMPFKKKNQD